MIVEKARKSKVTMKIWSIPEDDLRRICIEDSSFDPAAKDRSQHGWLIGYTTPDMAVGIESPISLVDWKSKKLRRKANSSLLCEAQSANISMAKWLLIANLEMSFRYAHFRIGKWALAPKVEEETSVLTRQAVMRKDPRGMIVMDAKSLYDALNSEQQNQDESRSALEAYMVKEDMERMMAIPRWIPHDKNPADALTKVHNAHSQPLEDMLRSHMLTIVHEDIVMDQRTKEREEKGYNPRRHATGVSTSDCKGKKKKTYLSVTDQSVVEDPVAVDPLLTVRYPATVAAKPTRKARRESYRRYNNE